MDDEKKLISSSEVIVRCDETNQVVMLSALPETLGTDTIRAEGIVGPYGLAKTIPVAIHILRKELDKFQIREREVEDRAGVKEIYFIDGNGNEAKQKMYLNVISDASGRFEVSAGQYHSGDGRTFDVALYTDVDPVTVIIAVAAVCAVLILIDAAISDCYEEHALAIENCKEIGGIPVATMRGTFGVTFTPEFRLGCDVWCDFDCKQSPSMKRSAIAKIEESSEIEPASLSQLVTTTTTRTEADGSITTVTKTIPVSLEKQAAGDTCIIEVYLKGFRVSTHTPDIGDDWRLKIWVDGNLLFVKHIQLSPGRTWNPPQNELLLETIRLPGKCNESVITGLMVETWEIDTPPFDPHDMATKSENIPNKCKHGHSESVTLQTTVFEDGNRGTDSVITLTYLRLKYLCPESEESTAALM